MATSLSSLNWQVHRLHIGRRLCQHVVAAAAASSSSSSSPNQVLHAVCEQHGIRLDPSVQLARTGWGYGLCRSQHTHADPVVAVPLHLVLSCSIPGCSPTPEQMCPALQQLLHSSAVSESWEMQIAVLLLWALRQAPPQSRIGSFWRQYRPLLPGGVQDCSSLLVWSAAELQELQVGHSSTTGLDRPPGYCGLGTAAARVPCVERDPHTDCAHMVSVCVRRIQACKRPLSSGSRRFMQLTTQLCNPSSAALTLQQAAALRLPSPVHCRTGSGQLPLWKAEPLVLHVQMWRLLLQAAAAAASQALMVSSEQQQSHSRGLCLCLT